MSIKTRQRILLYLTLIEMLCLGLYIYVNVATSSYVFDIVLNGFTRPWLGNKDAEIASKYNVSLMQNLLRISDISLIGLLLANILRFVFCKKRARIIFGIGIGLILLGIGVLQISAGDVFILALLLIFVGVGFVIASHWLGKDYKENFIGIDNQDTVGEIIYDTNRDK